MTRAIDPDAATATPGAARDLRGADRDRAGMSCVNTSTSSTIPILMEMVGGLSRAQTPHEVLREFAQGVDRLERHQGYIALSTRDLEAGEYRITRRIIGDRLAERPEVDPWNERDRIPVHRGGFLGQLIRQAYPELIHNLDVKDDPVLGDTLAPFGSLMAIPLFDNGEPLNWAIMLHYDSEGFSIEDLEESILRSNLVGSTVRNVLAAQELRTANATIRREVEQIAAIQRALLPSQLPRIRGASLAATYETFDQAGGDYYDFFHFPGDGTTPERWGLLIADAAGHGPAAAVMMAMLHAILHALPEVPHAPGVALDHANAHLSGKGIEASFVTAFFAIYEPETRTLTYARAGHPPALVKHAGPGGRVDRLDAVGGVPLGVLPDVTYENATITLEPGQTIVMYTDGIVEAASPDRRFFGVEGIVEALHECSGQPDCVQESIGSALREHEGGVRPSDDQTLVAMRLDDASPG